MCDGTGRSPVPLCGHIREVQIKETHNRLTKLHGTRLNFVFKLVGQAAADQVAMAQSSRLLQLVWSLFVGDRGEREHLLKRLCPQMALDARMVRRGLWASSTGLSW